MEYIGMDVHKRYCYATVMDEDGVVLRREKFASTIEGIHDFLNSIEDEAVFVIESVGFWEYIYEEICNAGYEVKLCHPRKVRVIAEARIKTDKVDSEILAHLLRTDLLPESYVPPKRIRDLRRLVRHRVFLKRKSTSIKNRIHSEILRRGIVSPYNNIFTKKGRIYLESLEIPMIDQLLKILKDIEKEIDILNELLLEYYSEMPDAQLLTTIPGIGFYSALVIISEIGDIHRFPSPEKLCAYSGLIPSTHQSGGIEMHGHITKEGSRHLRWILTEAIHVHKRIDPDSIISRFYHRIERKKGKGRAVIAASRKLLTVIYWMLMFHEPFHSQGFNPECLSAHNSASMRLGRNSLTDGEVNHSAG